jgi:translation elongation factor EF-G
LSIDKSIKAIKIPEVKIPAQKEVDFSEVIKQLKSLEKSLVVPAVNSDVKTQDALNTVLGKVESGLNNVVVSVNKLDKEIAETEDHSKDIIKGLKEVKSAINGLSFPVSNFSSQGIVDAIVHLESILSGEINVDVDTTGLATEATLAKLTSLYQQIEQSDDNITTINYTDATKVDVATIVQSSVTVGATATETFNNSGDTTLVITRGVE